MVRKGGGEARANGLEFNRDALSELGGGGGIRGIGWEGE
jgi:hypothetical protein